MDYYHFKEAKAVWIRETKHSFNRFAGFYTCLCDLPEEELHLAIAVRTFYRLFLDGRFIAAGPARTAEGFCRVDEITVHAIGGNCHIAIEVLNLQKPNNYANDCTLEPGLLIAEITNGDGKLISATGSAAWLASELPYRRMETELMSHCRGIVEYDDLYPDSTAWMTGAVVDFMPPAIVEDPVYLRRRAPYPDYKPLPFERFLEAGDIVSEATRPADRLLTIMKYVNCQWYTEIPKENCFQQALMDEKDAPLTGVVSESSGMISACPGDHPLFLLWGSEKSDVGFLSFETETTAEAVIDVVTSDIREEDGSIPANTYTVRYHLAPGAYRLITWEPKLCRYVKLIIRSKGQVRVTKPELFRDTYPENGACGFECSDGELNRIYEAALLTLRLNTLDIFMDCPERERGGWLCDSFFTSRGAWQMLGDLSVEKDFIENFMLTDPQILWHGFFPEVYPSSKKDPSSPGIANWSFWLGEELAEYAWRSGDNRFIEACRDRMSAFAEGILSARGESGLLENLPGTFVDWSISNTSFNLEPISIANNCLAIHTLCKLSDLYGVESWRSAAESMRSKLMELHSDPFSSGDAAVIKDGKLIRQGCLTEAAIALEIFSGFHRDDPVYIRDFLRTMGPAPDFFFNPSIGKANLFIGLMIRMCVLADLWETERLVREMKAVYLPELSIGPGTLFEQINARTGCHGFNAAVGSMLMSNVLGLGAPCQQDKTVFIRPDPCGLTWASGFEHCADGRISLRWHADPRVHKLDMFLTLPDEWTFKVDLPFSLNGWTVTLNGKTICV